MILKVEIDPVYRLEQRAQCAKYDENLRGTRVINLESVYELELRTKGEDA